MLNYKSGSFVSVVIMCLVFAGSIQAQGFMAPSDDFPVIGGMYVSMEPTRYESATVDIELVALSLKANDRSDTISPSHLGSGLYQIDSFFDVFTELSIGGEHFPVDSFFDVFCELTVDIPNDSTGTFQTEMVSMDLTGDVGGMPIFIREDQRLPSPGQTTITDLGNGQFQVDSFFDIFTEISIDGGQTWNPSIGPTRLMLQPGSTGGPCPARGAFGDFDCSGDVGLLDLDILGAHWGQTGVTYAQGDATGDNKVGLLDLDVLGLHWGQPTPIPEPTTLSLLALATLISIRRH